jgi:hypothetical protein
MDCRTFRHHHCAFVDDVLPGADVVEMERHRVACERCAAYDARVRRSLLVVRNLPSVECSAEFADRLFQRLRGLEVERHSRLVARGPGLGTFAAAAAALLVVAGGGLFAIAARAPQAELVLRPVIASTPAPIADPLASPVIAASASAGVPMWPALLLADEVPLHVARSGLSRDGFRNGFRAVGLTY